MSLHNFFPQIDALDTMSQKIDALHKKKVEQDTIIQKWKTDNPNSDPENVPSSIINEVYISAFLNKFKTYLVGGKGFYTINKDGTPKETFTVPKDCCIVLTTIEESTITDDKPLLVHYMEYYQKLFEKDLATLQKPELFKDELGETTIFETNDQCPDIHETLLLYDDGQCFTNMNGIVDISRTFSAEGLPKLDASIHSLTSEECKSVDFLKNLYSNSIYPNINSGLFGNYIDKLDTTILLKEWEKSLSIGNNNFYNILKTEKLTGIFYCFVVKKSMQVYVISAHGFEDIKSTFIVPKGSTIVVHSISGRVVPENIFRNKLKTLFTIPLKRLQYPNNDVKLELDTIIYNEGTICPLFHYELYGFIKDKHTTNTLSFQGINGLLNLSQFYKKINGIPLISEINVSKLNTNNRNNIQSYTELLSSLYTYSFFPTMNEVRLYYTHNVSQTHINSWSTNKLILINQKELCDMYPGVYYNFVCRSLSTKISNTNKNILKSINVQNTPLPASRFITNTNTNLLQSTNVQNTPLPEKSIIPGISTRKASGEYVFSKNVRNALSRRIGETHMYRRNRYVLTQNKEISETQKDKQFLTEQIQLHDNDIAMFKDQYTKWKNVLNDPKTEQERIQSLPLPEPVNLTIDELIQIANDNMNECDKQIRTRQMYIEQCKEELKTIQIKLNDLLSSKKHINNSMKKGGGPLPLRYFDPNAYQSSASAGSDVLGVSGLEVRPKIGGKRTKRTKRTRTTRRMKGGFIPSIMEPFIFGCSKYIAPLAALSGWKLINMPTNRKTKRVTRK
jgi:hypothetical protein